MVIMVLLKVFLVLCSVAYVMSLNANFHVDARDNSDIETIESRGIYVKSSAYLELYFFFSSEHKKHVPNGNENVYLEGFVKRMNQIFETQKDILNVKFIFSNASEWNPGNETYISNGTLNAEALKAQLKKYVTDLETAWKKTRPPVPISAFVFLTPDTIMNKTEKSETGINGRIGGICLDGEKVAAATDNGNYSGVRETARQLSFLMGAVKDGEGPPGAGFVRGSDGAKHCNPKDGFLMGEWKKNETSFKLSRCCPYQYIMGLRQRGPGCYGSPEEKKKLLKTANSYYLQGSEVKTLYYEKQISD